MRKEEGIEKKKEEEEEEGRSLFHRYEIELPTDVCGLRRINSSRVKRVLTPDTLLTATSLHIWPVRRGSVAVRVFLRAALTE